MTETAGPEASAPAVTSGVGARLGEYELVHDLSADTDSKVFLARSKGANGVLRVLMLECPLPAMIDRAGGAAAVIALAQAAAKIKSLNVVPPIEAGESDGVFVVSDPIDGASLSELIAAAGKAEEKIALDAALRIIVDALGGLHAAHQIKPDAVFHGGLSPVRLVTAAEGTTKATDFVLGRYRSDVERTAYVSDLAGPASAAGDIYSVGVIAWELITGKKLFGGDAPVVTDRTGEIPAPSTLAENIPAKLDAAIGKALSRDAAARFATAGEFARAIETSGAKVALRSAVGALITKLLKDPLTQRRELVRRLRTATTTAAAAGAAGSTATRAPTRATLPAPAGAPPVAKPGEAGARRSPTTMGIPMPKPPTFDTHPAESEPVSAATATASPPTEPSSTFGSPAISPGSPIVAPRAVAPDSTRIDAPTTPRADTTQPIEALDLISIVPAAPPATPPATPPKVPSEHVTPIATDDVADMGDFEVPSAPESPPPVVAPPPPPVAIPVAAAAPSEAAAPTPTPAAPTPAAPIAVVAPEAAAPVPAIVASPVESDIEIPVESAEAVPAPVVDVPKTSPKVLATAPLFEGFDDDEPIHLPTHKSNTKLYALIGGVAALIIGVVAFSLRGGSSTDTHSTSAPPGESAPPATNAPSTNIATPAPPTVTPPAAPVPAVAATATADAAPTVANAPPTPPPPPTIEPTPEPPPAPAPTPPPPSVAETPVPPTAPAHVAPTHTPSTAAHAAHVAPPPPAPARPAPHVASPAHTAPPPTRPARPATTTAHTAPTHTAPPPHRHEFRPGGL